jgi:ATP-dependent DNA helicase RecG
LMKEQEAKLPFTLTKEQKDCVTEIVKDMSWEKRMYRLLQWEVWSGKTEVVMMTMAHVLSQDMQSLLLCPTKILAKQQYGKIKKFFAWEAEVALITGDTPIDELDEILKKVKSWHSKILVGTHSIISQRIIFKNLALSVIDEQHKFGVIERIATLKWDWHLLEISATPIPRSLAQSDYGILKITSLKWLPPGRTPPITTVFEKSDEINFQANVNMRLEKGDLVYRVCPTIIWKSGVYKTKEVAERLFPNKRIGIIYSQKNKKKNDAMNDTIIQEFIDHKIDVLIATSIIESWLDIPDAKCIIIEDPEKFWLSNLHQLRGRVGRDTRQGYCFLRTDIYNQDMETSDEKTDRQLLKLKVFQKETDWYVIAQEDLALRGEWDPKGLAQKWFL